LGTYARIIDRQGEVGETVPVKDELERALASMRAGFLSGSSQIAAGVASLEEQLAEAPPDESEKVGAAVAQIVATQERLIVQIERLPAPSWERFKRMVGILKAQQAILDELGLLVQEHVLPRQLQGLSEAAATAAAPPPVHAPTPPRRRSTDDDAQPPERERGGSSLKGLAAMIVAALMLSLIPRETKLEDIAAKLAALVGAGGEAAPKGVASAGTGAEPPKTSSPAARVPPDPDETAAADKAAAAPPGPSEEKRAGAADRAGRVAAVQPGAKPPAGPPPEQFVPVVFTHKDHETVEKTLADLQQQFPKVLMDRKGEIQPVDLGKKGIWHRLVFLPAGPRPEATKLCDRLMAEGYDRCWVKTY
jgi:hypothetical protein